MHKTHGVHLGYSIGDGHSQWQVITTAQCDRLDRRVLLLLLFTVWRKILSLDERKMLKALALDDMLDEGYVLARVTTTLLAAVQLHSSGSQSQN